VKLLLAIQIALLLDVGCPAAEQQPAKGAGLMRFAAAAGSKVSLTGEYSIHDWEARGTLIGGFLEVAPGFPSLPGTSVGAATLPGRAEVFIPVRNLQAVGETWEPYNEQRTAIMHRMLRAEEHPRIFFRLSQLQNRTPLPSETLPTFVASGELVIAGVTNQVSLPFTAERLHDGSLRLSGKTTIKQSDFAVIPKPAAFRCFGADPDPVEIAFDWILKESRTK
jgi:hypothetical protein